MPVDEEADTLVQIRKEKKQTLMKKFDIPIESLSYEYIGECKKPKELERIVRILRSGEEGSYPHLTNFAEQRLAVIKPKSLLLRVVTPVLPRDMLDRKEREELEDDVEDWLMEMRLRERDLADERSFDNDQCLPQPSIRMCKESFIKAATAKSNRRKESRIGSCDYSNWDKYDADTELNRMDILEEQEKIAAKKFQEQQKRDRLKTKKEVIIEKSLLTGTELSVMAAREREKGNEAFRTKDYEEALQLYNTSIAMDSDINSYNNRAITHIKLKNYDKAVEDCNAVLIADCENLKALLRRGLAYENLKKNTEALHDYEEALKIDPMNKVALARVKKLGKYDDSKPVRLTIEEIYDDE